jgi:hypothetical protein
MGPTLKGLRTDLEAIASDATSPGLPAAVELLHSLHVHHPAVIRRAQELADEVLGTPTHVTRNAFGGTSHDRAGQYGRYLAPDVRAALAGKLADIAEDGATIELERTQAVYALLHLAPTLERDERGALFDRIWPLADGPRSTDRDVPIGAGSLAIAVLTAGGHLAATAEQTSIVEQVALVRLTDDHTAMSAARALVAMKAPVTADPGTLMTFRHTAARHAAAIIWAHAPIDQDLGRHLAGDPEASVRASVGRGLIEVEASDSALAEDLRNVLRADVSATVRLIANESLLTC